MLLFQQIGILLVKEFKIEWRQRHILGSIFLYVLNTIFIIYLAFQKTALDNFTWNALFWLVMLFNAVNATAKSFIQENESLQIFLYSVSSARAVILSKIIYNCCLLAVLSGITLFFYSYIQGNPVQDKILFFVSAILGSIGLGSILSVVSAIVSKASNKNTLMAILSFPLVIPLLLMVIKLSMNAIDGTTEENWKSIAQAGALIGIIFVSAYLLFPYIWKD